MKESTHLQDQTRGDHTLARRVGPLVSYQWSGSKRDEGEREGGRNSTHVYSPQHTHKNI